MRSKPSTSAADGNGAGTYQLQWAQHRPYVFTVIDAHSLYLEVLGELGLVGFLLIGGVVLSSSSAWRGGSTARERAASTPP